MLQAPQSLLMIGIHFHSQCSTAAAAAAAGCSNLT
jgi:hypothetical protein